MGQGSNKKDLPIKEESPPMEWDFSMPLKPAPDTFFLRSSLAPEKEFVNGLYNAAIFHAITKKIPKAIIRWDKNRWYGIIIDIDTAKGNIAGKA